MLDAWMLELRDAVRSVRREPAFAALMAVTLALGVGGVTAFFSLVEHAVLRPLPYRDPGRLVAIEEFRLERGPTPIGRPGRRVSYPNVAEIRSWLDVFDGLAVLGSSSFFVHGADEPLNVRAGLVEPGVFDLLGVPPTLGAPLRRDDSRHVVLSHGLWRDHFGASPNVVGTAIRLDDEGFEIVGVMPPSFLADRPDRLWVTLTPDTQDLMTERRYRMFDAVGRLAEGVSLEQARAVAAAAATRLASTHPDTSEGWGLWMVPLHDAVVGRNASTLWRLFGAAALLLLIASLNVANLQLARLTRNQRALAIRAALGAGLGRLARLAAAQSILVGLAGAAAGVVLANVGLTLFVALDPSRNPRLADAQIGLAALEFAVTVAIASSLIVGLVPVWSLRFGALSRSLLGGVRTGSGHPSMRRLRDGVLVAQIAVTAALLAGAALVSASFMRLWTYDLGFSADDVVTIQLTPDRARYPDPAGQYGFYRGVLDRVAALPGVEAVGSTSRLPLGTSDVVSALIPESDLGLEVEVRERPVTGDYFEAMRIPLLAGRSLAGDDERRIMVNAAAAAALWPGARPAAVIGRRARLPQVRGLPDAPPQPWREVVGVVGNVRHGGLEPEPLPEFYLPQWEQMHLGLGGRFGRTTLVVRAPGFSAALTEELRDAVWAEDALAPVQGIRAMTTVVAESRALPRFHAVLFSAFGLLALTFAVAGVFGITAYLVGTRQREIGIRRVVGASSWSIAQLIVGHALRSSVVGLAAGLLGAVALSRLLQSFLHGVSATDFRILASAAAVMLAATIAAASAPCMRAIKVDPATVLRDE